MTRQAVEKMGLSAGEKDMVDKKSKFFLTEKKVW